MDEISGEPERSPEDQIIASFLKERSPTYRSLREISTIVWSDSRATAYFARERGSADNPGDEGRRKHYNLMRGIGDEMQRETGVLELQRPRPEVLDLCMAPGGYTASIRKYSRQANVSAITLPEDQGGLKILVPHGNRTQVEVLEADIIMFAAEFGVVEIPDNHPEASKFSNEKPFQKKLFDLVFCDGHVTRTRNRPSNCPPTELSRLECSQLVLAMQRIREGGTLIILLHGADVYHSVKLLEIFGHFSHIQVFKPVRGHTRKSSFYLVAKEMQPGRLAARAAVTQWKQNWKDATFPAPAEDEIDAHNETEALLKQVERKEDSSKLVENFGARLIQLGEPIWEIQEKALKALMERLEQGSAKPGMEKSAETSEECTTADPAVLTGLARDTDDSS
ncbi:hypothetical protein HO133_005333 [Letharia lupina]|uniref:Ribosomal RNA methyltransferase FtsJ domain-containing protein n=1 Tax=Letharia lupina TaxID=560253 RepID=A0A8H6C893_9LECA|nr:uncharacterized protein HO133_005333 [Letharia lupina]KAF6218790.1 hypothetical protein HO133_005333 [Letharia lupina]